jgi:hypothetical protein
VSTTTKPVTHTAEVDVKKALTRGVACPAALDMGSMSRMPPMTIRPAKPNIKVRDSELLVRCLGSIGMRARHDLARGTWNPSSVGFMKSPRFLPIDGTTIKIQALGFSSDINRFL